MDKNKLRLAAEKAKILHLIQNVHPTGIVSIVSDTYDFWGVLSKIVPSIKDEILAREGRVVFRPDSGNPVDIVAGLNTRTGKDYIIVPTDSPEYKGSIELLYEIFGGTEINGHKHLDPHVGLIYGDGISIDRLTQICQRLIRKGFSTNNLVFGIGSFTYQHVTRDSLGIAMKATYIEIDGEGKNIFKDPKTKGVMSKKSAKGLIGVYDYGIGLVVLDERTWAEENSGKLEEVYRDGKILTEVSLRTIRERIQKTY